MVNLFDLIRDWLNDNGCAWTETTTTLNSIHKFQVFYLFFPSDIEVHDNHVVVIRRLPNYDFTHTKLYAGDPKFFDKLYIRLMLNKSYYVTMKLKEKVKQQK